MAFSWWGRNTKLLTFLCLANALWIAGVQPAFTTNFPFLLVKYFVPVLIKLLFGYLLWSLPAALTHLASCFLGITRLFPLEIAYWLSATTTRFRERPFGLVLIPYPQW